MSNLVRYNQPLTPLTSIFDEFEKNINRILSAYLMLGNDFSSVGNLRLLDVDVKKETVVTQISTED